MASMWETSISSGVETSVGAEYLHSLENNELINLLSQSNVSRKHNMLCLHWFRRPHYVPVTIEADHATNTTNWNISLINSNFISIRSISYEITKTKLVVCYAG